MTWWYWEGSSIVYFHSKIENAGLSFFSSFAPAGVGPKLLAKKAWILRANDSVLIHHVATNSLSLLGLDFFSRMFKITFYAEFGCKDRYMTAETICNEPELIDERLLHLYSTSSPGLKRNVANLRKDLDKVRGPLFLTRWHEVDWSWSEVTELRTGLDGQLQH